MVIDRANTDKLLSTTRAVRKHMDFDTGDDFKPAKRPPGKAVMHVNGWKL